MLINGKTPERIKCDIERCSNRNGCAGCRNIGNIECVEDNMNNALALIKHLERRIFRQNVLLAALGVSIPEEDSYE